MARYPDRVRRPSPYLEKAVAHRTDDFGTIPEAPLVPAFPYQRGRVTDCCDESVADTDYVDDAENCGSGLTIRRRVAMPAELLGWEKNQD